MRLAQTKTPPDGVPADAPQTEGLLSRYLPRTFDALRFGPFRWYLGALIWWNAAMSMQMLVRGYLTYQVTGSFTALGVIGLASAVPMLILSPWGGVLADRTSRRTVLQLGQAFSLVVALVVATFIFVDLLNFWVLFGASIAQGTMMAMVMPSRQAFLPEVVGMRRLMNAIPLQSASMNLMQILGPALGGFIIDWIGAGSVYVLMALMYGASVVMLFRVASLSEEDREAELAAADAEAGATGVPSARRRARTGPRKVESPLKELGGGLRYLAHNPILLSILSFAFLGSILGMPIRRLLPGYVADVYADSGSALGLMQTGMGLGALAGALILATLSLTRHRGLVFAGSALLMGVALLLYSLTDIFWLAWLALAAVGVGTAGRQALSQMLVQHYVEEEFRGRVMSVFMMQISAMNIGAFFVSLFMDLVGPRIAIGTLGITLILVTIVYVTLVTPFRRLA